MDYGSVIRTARKKAGMTQKELAEAMGVSEAFICQYEKGKRIPKPSTLAKFAEATGTIFAPAMLFEESEEGGETVGERIRRYRKAAKLTQAELGRAINAAAITIRQYEIGAREPKLAQLQAVAAALGVPLTALVDDNIRTGGNYSGVDAAPATPGSPAPSLGQRIRETRIAAGLTQTTLGNTVGESKQTIFKYESGVIKNIPLNTLTRIAEALGVSPEWLGFGADTPPVPAAAGAPHQSAALTASPRGSQDEREEVRPMNELDRFRMAAEELELGDRAAILISRTLGKLQTEVMKLGDDCPGGAHRIEALSGILSALAPVLEKLGTETDCREPYPRNDPAEEKDAAPVVATPGRQTKKAGT